MSCLHAIQTHTLMSSARAGFDVHGIERKRQSLRQKPDQLFVGGAIDRWSRNSNLQRIAVNSDTGCSRSFRLDMDREDGSVLAVLHDPRSHS